MSETPDTPAQAAAAKLTVKDLLASISQGKAKILKERPVELYLPDGETVVDIMVKELTKSQYDKFLIYTTREMPEIPTIEQRYTQARRNPLTGEIKPAGSYMEPNPSDPSYIAATKRWFNNSAALFGLFASAEDFGMNLSLEGEELRNHLDERFAEISEQFPTTTLLDIAYQAALVNRGIPVAEQLISAVEAHAANARLEEIERALDESPQIVD